MKLHPFKALLHGVVWAGLLVGLYLPIGETVDTEAGKLVTERWSLVSLALGSVFSGDPLDLRWPYVLCTSVVVAAGAGFVVVRSHGIGV